VTEPPLYTRTFWTACLIHLTGALSLSQFLLFPLFVRALGGTGITVGLVLGISTAASVATRPLVGGLLDRYGRRRILMAAGALNAVSYLCFLTVDRVGPALYVWATVHAIAGGALFAAFFTYATDLTPPTRRAEGIAVFGVAGMTANGLGPPIGEWLIDGPGYPAYFTAAAVFGLLSVVLTTLVAPDVPVRSPGAVRSGTLHDLGAALRHPGLARVFVTTVLLGVAINAAFFFVAPFVRSLGPLKAGPFFTAYAGTSIVTRLFGRRLLDTLGPYRGGVPAFLVFAVGLASLRAVPAPWVLVGCGVACGLGHGALFPLLGAVASVRAPAGMQGTVMGLFTGALDLGAMVGTPLCGALVDTVGYAAMFAVTAGACIGGVVMLHFDRRSTQAAIGAGGGG
jgi:predicted MFS family arabinose efflux permease